MAARPLLSLWGRAVQIRGASMYEIAFRVEANRWYEQIIARMGVATSGKRRPEELPSRLPSYLGCGSAGHDTSRLSAAATLSDVGPAGRSLASQCAASPTLRGEPREGQYGWTWNRTYELIVALFAVAISACAGPASEPIAPSGQVADDNLIVPGQRIGPVYLGMSPEVLLAALGPPDWSRGPSANRIQYGYESRGLYIYVNVRNSRVDGVVTSDSRYRTTKGIQVGDSELELVVGHGSPKWRWHNAHPGDDGYVVYCYSDGTSYDLGGPRASDAGRIRDISLGGCIP